MRITAVHGYMMTSAGGSYCHLDPKVILTPSTDAVSGKKCLYCRNDEQIEKCWTVMTSDLQYVGTMLSGLSAFCCGKSRMHSRENKAMSVFCVNLMVGTMQFCTVTFLLVGWAWSLVWGIYMIILAGKKSEGYYLCCFQKLLDTPATQRASTDAGETPQCPYLNILAYVETTVYITYFIH